MIPMFVYDFIKLNTRNYIYTGIGSRETPSHVLTLMTEISTYLSSLNFILRSGGASGADSSFEVNATKKEIYLPWKRFNNKQDGIVPNYQQLEAAASIAKQFHPAWDRCSQGAKKLHSRNGFQVLGLNLDSPTDFIICWTKQGAGQGGTGQALRIAKHYNIPILDLGSYI